MSSPQSENIMKSSRRGDLEYQSFMLDKVFETRAINDRPFQALKQAIGLNFIPPETEVRSEILKSLMPKEIDDPDHSGIESSNCEILMVVAMYNESSVNFIHTMEGINQNLEEFHKNGVDTEKIACIVIVDGMKAFLEIYSREKNFFKEYFDEQQVLDRFRKKSLMDCDLENRNENDEIVHCFMQKIEFGTCTIPLKMIFAVKQHNKRKLNTHLWFFGGFCVEINPKYTILLDVGTRPLPGSLFYMYEALECNENLAGCCGEIRPMKPNFWKIVVPAQVVEYKFAHMLDKALESVIGFITVLPGAFSAYRWDALRDGTNEADPDSIQGSPLWEDYFMSICHPELMDAFHSNIYLAEDRVLCLSLFTKKNKAYTLRYVKKSIAETDVPDSISVLMAQRRRWINGSWFALVDSLRKWGRVFASSHNCCRKFFFSIQMFYYFINVIYSWFLVGAFALAVDLAISILFSNNPNSDNYSLKILSYAIFLFYLMILMILFVVSLAVKPKRIEDLFKAIVTILGIYQIFILGVVIWFLLTQHPSAQTITMGVGLTACGFALIVILNWEMMTVAYGCLHYILLIPTYVNVFLIYSICNVHDCTWGNRPDALNKDEKDRLEEFEEFRAKWVIIWFICNSAFSYFISLSNDSGSSGAYDYFLVVSVIGMGILMLRVVGGIVFLFTECCHKTFKEDPNRVLVPITRKVHVKAKLRKSMSMKRLSKEIKAENGNENTGLVNSKGEPNGEPNIIFEAPNPEISVHSSDELDD